MTHPFLLGPRPRVFAHRGLVPEPGSQFGSPLFSENTIASFDTAVAAGVSYVETDCHLSRDGEVVLFHDADLARIAHDSRAIVDLDLPELRSIMAERGGLLTLRDALHRYPETRFNIDIKAAAAAELTGQTVVGHTHRVLLTSFSDVTRVRALGAASQRGALPATSPGRSRLLRLLAAVQTRSRPLIDRAFYGLDALQIPERAGRLRVLTPLLLREAHRRAVEVHVWTVNDVARMRVLTARGVDGIVTDRADLALSALRRVDGNDRR